MAAADGRALRLAPWLAVLAALVALAACAGDPERAGPARPSVKAGEFGTPDCFLRRALQDFEVLDDRNLIVFAPGKSEAYHVQVSPPAPELRFASVLAFASRSSRICGYAGDGLLVDDSGPGARRLSVTGVFRLDEAALAGLQARFGKGEGQAGSPAPRPGEGAAIERDLDGEGGEGSRPRY